MLHVLHDLKCINLKTEEMGSVFSFTERVFFRGLLKYVRSSCMFLAISK
jgi:hypothetical protein